MNCCSCSVLIVESELLHFPSRGFYLWTDCFLPLDSPCLMIHRFASLNRTRQSTLIIELPKVGLKISLRREHQGERSPWIVKAGSPLQILWMSEYLQKQNAPFLPFSPLIEAIRSGTDSGFDCSTTQSHNWTELNDYYLPSSRKAVQDDVFHLLFLPCP